jgi:hypothetical protein
VSRVIARVRARRPETSMVRMGSTVRVRQRASLKCLQNGRAPCLGSKRPSRAGTRGLSLMFPCWAHRHAEFGLFNEIWPRPTPSIPRRIMHSRQAAEAVPGMLR